MLGLNLSDIVVMLGQPILPDSKLESMDEGSFAATLAAHYATLPMVDFNAFMNEAFMVHYYVMRHQCMTDMQDILKGEPITHEKLELAKVKIGVELDKHASLLRSKVEQIGEMLGERTVH